MSDSMKEDTSLKTSTDIESVTLKKEELKEKVPENSVCELIITILCVIIFLCVVLYILFQDMIGISKIQKMLTMKKPQSTTPTPPPTPAKPQPPKPKPTKHRLKEKKVEAPVTCQEGFYIPTDAKVKNKCLKCPVEGCSKCAGDSKHTVCLSCMATFTPVLGKNKRIESCMKTCEKGVDEKCLTCNKHECGSCNIGYNLVKGKCVLNHSLKATFVTHLDKENIMLINKHYVNDIEELFIDGQKVPPSYSHTFPKKGAHDIIMSLKPTIVSGANMFSNLTHLISMNFTHEFGKINMANMHGMFNNCTKLKLIDLSNLKTHQVKDFSYMFNNCTSLTSLDLSHLDTKVAINISYMFSNSSALKTLDLSKMNTQSVAHMDGMFMGCSSIQSLDLSKFVTKNVETADKMFYGCSNLKHLDISSFVNIPWNPKNELFDKKVAPTGSIKISKKFYEKTKNNIPKTWKKIEIR